jgi:hypothetical protein
MERALTITASPAAVAGLAAASLWAPATGYPTWPAAARGRLASTLATSLAVGWFVFLPVRRIGALTAE